MKAMKSVLLGIALFASAFAATAQNEQFIPRLVYRRVAVVSSRQG